VNCIGLSFLHFLHSIDVICSSPFYTVEHCRSKTSRDSVKLFAPYPQVKFLSEALTGIESFVICTV